MYHVVHKHMWACMDVLFSGALPREQTNIAFERGQAMCDGDMPAEAVWEQASPSCIPSRERSHLSTTCMYSLLNVLFSDLQYRYLSRDTAGTSILTTGVYSSAGHEVPHDYQHQLSRIEHCSSVPPQAHTQMIHIYNLQFHA